MKTNNKKGIEVPNCPRCGQKTYMIRREDILEIDENKDPWMCVKCTQEKLLLINSDKESSDELAHLEGKIPYFACSGQFLQLDPKTRQYKVVSKKS